MTPGEFIEVFDEIAEAPEGIERLRELVLQFAVRGRLVPQDANEEPASVLLERIADEKFRLFREGKLRIPKPVPPIATDEAPFDVPDQWEWVRLGDIANSRLGKMLDKSKNKGPYRRYLRNANVQWFRFDRRCCMNPIAGMVLACCLFVSCIFLLGTTGVCPDGSFD